MTKTLIASLVATAMYLVQPAQAADTELMATLQVMGYGYKVKVLVNGSDIGVQGGKSEGRRLFAKDDAMAAKAPPEFRAKNFVLVRGVNDVVIEYSKADASSNDAIEIAMEVEGYPQPLLKLVSRKSSADKVNAKVTVDSKPPAGFKPILLGEAK